VKKRTDSLNGRSRRSFLLGLAAATAVPELSPAQGTPGTPAVATAEQAKDSHSAEVDALTEIVRLRYGQYLQSADMPILQRGLERFSVTRQEVLKVDIHNGDGPDCVFQADGL
jgi:hypothetical protein